MQIPQNKEIHRPKNARTLRITLTLLGIATNIIMAFLTSRLSIPLFLGSIGTIAVSAISGTFFSGILTAVVSSVVCSIFFPVAIYFSFFNSMIAIATAWFFRKYSFRKAGRSLLFVFFVILYSALVTSCIQFANFGESQESLIAQNARSLASVLNISYFKSFLFINFMLEVLDKGFSFAVVVTILNFIPKEKLKDLKNGVWRQRPLYESELRAIKNWRSDVKYSLRIRNTLILVVSTVILISAMCWTGGRLYFEHVKSERTKIARNCIKFAADTINPGIIDDFIKHGNSHPDYDTTANLLYKIWKVSPGIQSLYIIKLEEFGGRFIFYINDTNNEKQHYNIGELISFQNEIMKDFPTVFSGAEIETVKSDTLFNWKKTLYCPVQDSSGKKVCYVGADITVNFINSYMATFLSHFLIIVAGFFLLIVAYAVWTTMVYTSYPISSIASCVESFSQTDEDQEKLDENVRAIRSLDIHTGDEVEKLYKAICRMTLNQAEQMRDIMRLSDSTLKMQDGLIITMADMVESRDSDTGAHVQKTAAYVKIIVEGLKKKDYYSQKITPKFMSDVVRSAPLHDVGKINIPDEVLNKPGKLSDEEFAIMKTHTTAGKLILENAISTVQGENYLKEARNMAAYHHERWDGSGYPKGLKGRKRLPGRSARRGDSTFCTNNGCRRCF